MAGYEKEISDLEALLNSGAKDVSTDGQRTSFDLEVARDRLAALRRLSNPTDTTKVRRKHASLNLGGCW